MDSPQQLPLYNELHRRLKAEHNPRMMASVFIDFTWVMLDTKEERGKRVECIKLIKPDDNVYYAAFLLEYVSRDDCKLMIQCLQKYFTQSNQFLLHGLLPTMHWNDTPNKELDFANLSESERSTSESKFTNRVFIYTNYFADSYREELRTMFKEAGYIATLRDTKTWNTMQQNRKADYFLCHDSRDKPVARELYSALVGEGLKIFFDEVSIDFGDSIYQKLEEGLRESTFGLILVSPNFIENDRWAKKLEFESFAVKYLNSGNNIIIPVWHDVTVAQVQNASAMLAGIKASDTNIGVPALAKQLRTFVDRKNQEAKTS